MTEDSNEQTTRKAMEEIEETAVETSSTDAIAESDMDEREGDPIEEVFDSSALVPISTPASDGTDTSSQERKPMTRTMKNVIMIAAVVAMAFCMGLTIHFSHPDFQMTSTQPGHQFDQRFGPEHGQNFNHFDRGNGPQHDQRAPGMPQDPQQYNQDQQNNGTDQDKDNNQKNQNDQNNTNQTNTTGFQETSLLLTAANDSMTADNNFGSNMQNGNFESPQAGSFMHGHSGHGHRHIPTLFYILLGLEALIMAALIIALVLTRMNKLPIKSIRKQLAVYILAVALLGGCIAQADIAMADHPAFPSVHHAQMHGSGYF